MNIKRRHLLAAAAGVCALGPAKLLASLSPTPVQAAGPFYPVELPLDDDNDLTYVRGLKGRAQGQHTDLSGRIVDLNGNPLKGLRIEIWQCDINGRYRHPRENANRPMDKYFQGHGNTFTDTEGRYRFRTIRPVSYPGRTPHIHVAVFPEQERPFVTQLYVSDEAQNQDDFLFNHVPAERRHMIVAEFKKAGNQEVELEASFDIVLDRRDGTPMEG
jgi:protocatechuate 3,4-dioxygenase beta subunit